MAAYVQKIATGEIASTTTLTLTVGVTTTAGNTVLIATAIGTSHQITGATDSKSNTYVVDVQGTTGHSAGIVRALLATALVSGDTITLTASGASTVPFEAAALEYSGIASTSPLDGSTVIHALTGSTITTATVTPTASGDLWFSAWSQNGPAYTPTVTSPFTARFSNHAPGGDEWAAADYQSSDATKVHVTWKSAGGTNGTACLRPAPTALLTLAATIKAQLEHPSTADPTAIAATLCCASAPVIVVGGDCALMRAAANIVTTLRRIGIAARLSILLPEANSLGLGLFGAPPLSAALAAIQTGSAPHVIVLENDLHRRSETGPLEHAFSRIASLSVLDCIETPTTATADLAIAVGSFADADGTIVNQEGRAQRSFKAIFGADDPAPSWHILRNAGIAAGRLEATAWASHRDLIEAMAANLPDLAACRTLWPHAHAGDMQRPPTLPHRYSGRTAVNAASHVREPQPFANPDSPLGPTMEGPMPRTGLMPHVWSPGWNSAQANLKFPSAAEPGVMLFPASTRIPTELPLPHPPSPTPGILALPIRRVFGSEELSNLAPAVASRVGSPILRLSPADAATRGLSAGTMVDCTIGTTTVRRTIALDPTMAAGVAGLTIGVQGEANPPLPGSLTITAIHPGEPS
jgi:hypothetical protein